MRRRTGPSSRRQLRALSISNVISNKLMLVHVTAVGAAREIVDSGQLEMQPCKVFSKDLTYFFVLRPAYRLNESDAKSDQINRFPFVFVVSPDNLGPPFHVYPFDTGGASAGVFSDRADEWVFLEDYELDPTLAAAAGHIAWAFGSTEAYFDGDLRPQLFGPLPPWQDVARSYVTVAGLAASGHNRPDKRASAIEVAYRQHVPLKENVKLAILPKQYLEDGTSRNIEFIAKLQAAGVDWEVYDWQPNITPDECQQQISRIARHYFKRLGAL